MQPDPKNNPTQVVGSDGIQRTIQIVGLADGYGSGLPVNGKNPGTFFGDDTRTTKRISMVSSKYTQGLPVHGVDYDFTGTGYWEIPLIGGVINGVSEIGTGTAINGKSFIRGKLLNRYEPGQLSYFIFTNSFSGLESATGDFIILIGACLGGLAADGQSGDIKEGMMFGWKRASGELSAIMRIYKNFSYTEYPCDVTVESCENLRIFHLEIGYLGIHPTLLYAVNTDGLRYDLVKKIEFTQDVTSVNDPNLTFGVYAENLGNDTNISVRNGSFQYGNYGERVNLSDASGRTLLDELSLSGGFTSGTDTFIAAYRIPNKATMINRLDGVGIQTSVFRNTVSNRLNEVQVTVTNNKPVRLNFYIIHESDITGAVWTVLNPNINLLERSVVGTPNLTNAVLLERLLIPTVSGVVGGSVKEKNHLLSGGMVAIITATSPVGTNISDFEMLLETEDLF